MGPVGGPYLRFVDMPGSNPAGALYNTLPVSVKAALGQYFDCARTMSKEERRAVGRDWPASSSGVDVTVAEIAVWEPGPSPR